MVAVETPSQSLDVWRRVILLVPSTDVETAFGAALKEIPGGVTTVTMRSALHARERLLLYGGGSLVIDLGSKAPFLKQPGELLNRIFGGILPRMSKGTRVVLISSGADASLLGEVARAVDEIKLPWDVVQRPIEVASLVEIFTDAEGAPAEAPRAAQQLSSTAALEKLADIPTSALEALRRGEFPLGAVPPVVAEVRRIAANRSSSAQVLAEAVARDPGLTATVMRRSRSVGYGPGAAPRTIRQAITRTGALEVAHIAEAMLAKSCYTVKKNELGDVMIKAWRHTVARSVIMRYAVRFESQDTQDRQYLLGLLADVGEGFLAKIMIERGRGLGAEERKLITEQHAVVGSALLESWGVSAECVDFAKRHHGDIGSNPTALRLLCGSSAAAGLGYANPFWNVTPRSLEEVSRVLTLHDVRDRDVLKREIEAELNEGVDPV